MNINNKKDYVHIYVPECDKIVNIGWSYIEEWIYKTKEQALEAMLTNIDRMKQE